MRNWNKGYLEWSQRSGITRYAEPILIHLYSEVLQKFRLAAQGKGITRKPPAASGEAHRDLLRSAAVLLRAAGGADHRHAQVSADRDDAAPDGDVPLVGFAERLAAPDPRAQLSVRESARRARGRHRRRRLDVGRIAVGQGALHVRYCEAVEPGTVWTWNAIGKAPGAWHLAPDANESQRGFLLNHLISDELPRGRRRPHLQFRPRHRAGGWYDVRVRIYRPRPEPERRSPQFARRAAPPRQRRHHVRQAAISPARRER